MGTFTSKNRLVSHASINPKKNLIFVECNARENKKNWRYAWDQIQQKKLQKKS